MEDSDVGEKLLAEEDAMKELAKAAPGDADEAPQISGIAPVEVDNVLEAPRGLASRGPSAAAMEIEIRAGIEKAKRCGFIGDPRPLHREGAAQALRHRRTNCRVSTVSAQC